MREGRRPVRKLMHNRFSAGNWIMTPKAFKYILHSDEAELLAFLIGIDAMEAADCDENNKPYSGWFTCRMERVCRELIITRNQHSRLFKILTKRGYIKVKLKGVPARRYILIDSDFLMAAIDVGEANWRARMEEAEDDTQEVHSNGHSGTL